MTLSTTPTALRPCLWCYREYLPNFGGQRFCQRSCGISAWWTANGRRTSRKPISEHGTRSRYRHCSKTPGGPCDPCRAANNEHHKEAQAWRYQRKLVRIAERDEWVCGICSLPVDRKLSGSELWGPTLDHVVPQSWGEPDNDDDNLQLAHRLCNMRKSDAGRRALIKELI